jgi:hypothetical protein
MDKFMEPTSTSAAAGIAGWKILSGAAGALGIGAAVASLIVMLMTQPRSAREWAVGLISTVMGSFGAGAYAAIKLGLVRDLAATGDFYTLFFGLCAIIGVAFSCGLPFWAIVRWSFTYMERRRDADIAQIAKEVREQLKG